MTQQPHELVWTLATAGLAARCVHVVADLGVADWIDDSRVPAAELASACGVDADALGRVMSLLAAHGIFDHRDGTFGHTASSRLLCSDHPMTMRPFLQMMGLPIIWGSITELGHSVRTGRPALEVLEPQGLWAHLQDHPSDGEIFGRAMTAKAGAEGAAVVDAFDFRPYRTIADIGGGRGHLLRAVLDVAPDTEGILFDLPEVIDSLDVEHPRMRATAGDFFKDALPAAHAYVLMEVLHDWPDKECVAILAAIRRAAHADSTLLVIEGVLPADHNDPRAATLDLIMLTVTGGRERTASQLSALLEQAGFRLDRVTETASPMRIVEATPV